MINIQRTISKDFLNHIRTRVLEKICFHPKFFSILVLPIIRQHRAAAFGHLIKKIMGSSGGMGPARRGHTGGKCSVYNIKVAFI